MRGIHGRNRVAVDTGTLLVVDPAYLFSQDEWRKMVVPGIKKNYKAAVFKAIEQKTGRNFSLSKLATLVETCGDGTFKVRMKKSQIVIDTNCEAMAKLMKKTKRR